jgi:hypothetical protein
MKAGRPRRNSMGDQGQHRPAPTTWAVGGAGRLRPMYWLSPYLRGGVRPILQRMPLVRLRVRPFE